MTGFYAPASYKFVALISAVRVQHKRGNTKETNKLTFCQQ